MYSNLPSGSVRLSEVWVHDPPYADFDAEAATVRLRPMLFPPKVSSGEDVHVVGACESVAERFVETGATEVAGGDVCRVDDESEARA